jgi:hypothetical protein
MTDPNVEIRIGENPTRLWVYESTLNRGEGPIMPEPNHNYRNPLGVSYAHLYSDGIISRFGRTIGRVEDIRRVGEIVVEVGDAALNQEEEG